VEAATGERGLEEAASRLPDLILLDLGLPDVDGMEVTRRLRAWSTTPIIVISARGREEGKVQALDAGADGYVTKPFAVGELLARMRVALRNAAGLAAGARRQGLDAPPAPAWKCGRQTPPNPTTCGPTCANSGTSSSRIRPGRGTW